MTMMTMTMAFVMRVCCVRVCQQASFMTTCDICMFVCVCVCVCDHSRVRECAVDDKLTSIVFLEHMQ